MSSDLDLPAELLSRPLALVGVTGLNVETNSTHLLIWNSFTSSGRSERPPLNFVLFASTHTFPPAKPERTSYEWYIPKGILKRKWMSKHLLSIPGVLVLFYDLEWDDPQWKMKHAECANLIQTTRMKLFGRGTKLCLVLLQNSPPLPSSEDVLAADRAAALCQVCELPPKSLFILPCRSDHLQGYTLRLESAFYELCQSSYHLSSRAVRSHRDQLNRTNHGYLFVRHQFKIGFYHELKQDVAMAHKHYTQSYAHLLELRITDANVSEVKIIAGYIAYKVWRLSFLLNLPREAIAHFRSHLDFFRLRIGHPLSKFEHHAWLAAQFSNFGRLFEDAIELGLPAIQTQHPGFYYQQAAQQAMLRKKTCQQDYSTLDLGADSVVSLPFGESSQLEYFGQRPWRPNRLSLEPADMKAENDGITSLLIRERLEVDLTALIVGALTNAVNQFKNHRSPRMKQYLLVQMAEEYCRSENFAEALTLLEPLLWDYRKDFWWLPLTSLLQLGLRCAYLSGRPAEYFSYAIELCSPDTVKEPKEKAQLFENLVGILDKRIPPPPPDADGNSEQSAVQLWTDQFASLTSGACITTIVTNTISSFVKVKATFTQKQFAAEELVELQVHISYTGPKPIQFSSLSVALNNAAYLPFCQVKDVEELVFEPNQIRHYEFEFGAQSQDIGSEIQITSVTLEMGRDLVAFLRCEGSSIDEFGLSRSEFPSACQKGLAGLFVLNTTEILPRSANVELNLQHEAPALRGECYPIHLELINREKEDITNVTLMVTTGNDGRVHDQPKIDGTRTVELKSDKIATGQTCHWNVFTQMEQPGKHHVAFQVNYEITSQVGNSTNTYKSQYVKTLELETVQPVECESQFQTLQFQSLRQVPVGEPCVAVVTVSNLSPFPLLLEQGVWKLDPLLTSQPMSSQLSGLTLEQGEKANDVAVLLVEECDNRQIRTGSYSLKWKRASVSKQEGFKIPYSASSFDLPEMETWSVPLRIHVNLPAHGFVRESMNMTITLHNPSTNYLELDVFMSSNDAFMFAGNKQIKVHIYPEDDYVLMYNLYPLLSGFVALPPLQLKATSTEPRPALDQTVLDELVSRYVPTHIYVLPQAKEMKKTGAISGQSNLLRSE